MDTPKINKRYDIDFILSLKDKFTEPPVGFHPVYIKQKRISVNHSNTDAPVKKNSINNIQNSNNEKHTPANKKSQDSKENTRVSFLNKNKNNNPNDIILGDIRCLLNKLTDNNFQQIISQIKELDFQKLDDTHLQDIAKIFLQKLISEKEHNTTIIDNLSQTFLEKINNFQDLTTNECIKLFDPIIKESFNDLQKCKCIGLFAILNILILNNCVNNTIIQNNIVNKLIDIINDRKNNFNSYATVALNGGCGIFIELLCKLYNNNINNNEYINSQNKSIHNVLNDVVVLPALPARLKFMIQDTIAQK